MVVALSSHVQGLCVQCLSNARRAHSNMVKDSSTIMLTEVAEEHAVCCGVKWASGSRSKGLNNTNTNQHQPKTQNTCSIVCKGSVWGIWRNRSIKRLQISGFQLLSVINFNFIQSVSTSEGQQILIDFKYTNCKCEHFDFLAKLWQPSSNWLRRWQRLWLLPRSAL